MAAGSSLDCAFDVSLPGNSRAFPGEGGDAGSAPELVLHLSS